jgi:hypothetical protein
VDSSVSAFTSSLNPGNQLHGALKKGGLPGLSSRIPNEILVALFSFTVITFYIYSIQQITHSSKKGHFCNAVLRISAEDHKEEKYEGRLALLSTRLWPPADCRQQSTF